MVASLSMGWPERTPAPPRSGLITALVAVAGLACLTLGLQWYSGHLDRLSRGPSSPPPPSQTAPSPLAPSGPPTPSPEQVAALDSKNAGTQRGAALKLASFPLTLELESAIRSMGGARRGAEEAVLCLKGRLPDLASLDALMAYLPPRDSAAWPSGVDESVCFVSVLAARVEEDPLRVVRALLPFAFSYLARLRDPALAAFKKSGLSELPADVERALREGWHDGLAVRAAIALRADEIAPHLLEEWLRSSDPKIRLSACRSLADTRRPSAFRLIARAASEYSDDKEFFSALRRGDAGPVLVELALDASETHAVRRRALELLGSLGSAKHVDALAPLLSDADPEIRAYAEAATAALRER
jgi:hypothetical protein